MAIVDINALYIAQSPEENDSKKTMIYTADNGATYKVLVSENIGEALGFDDFTNASTANEIPKNFRMRTITFSDSSGKVKGQYPCGKPSTPAYVEGGTITVVRKGSVAGTVCSIKGSQGEKRRFAQANDTGQQSGDNS